MSVPVRSAPAAALTLLLGAAFSGCLVPEADMLPLPERDWSRVETPHFEVFGTDSLDQGPGDLTTRLGVELEQFRAAAEHLWGRPLPAPARRIRVFAYNGAGGPKRPFRSPRRGVSSYLVARPAGDSVVFRNPYGWSEAAPIGLRLELARRLFRNADPSGDAPWLVEGMAQLASTSDVRGGRRVRLSEVLIFPLLPLKLLEIATDTPDRVEVGQPRSELVKRLRRDQWVPLERLAAAQDLAGWSQRDREMFEAQSWLLVHYLRFGPRDPDTAGDLIAPLRRSLDRGRDAGDALRAAAGEGLEHRLTRYARSRRFDGLLLGVEAIAPPAPERLLENEMRDPLGVLALSLDEPDLAERYFQDALVWSADSATLRAGLCAAVGQRGSEDASCQLALETAPDDPVVLRRVADGRLWAARFQTDPADRRDRAAQAASLYIRALAHDPDDPAVLYGLASARLEADDVDGALAALTRLHRWLPGDPEVQRLTARAALARGDRESARLWAGRAITTARNDAEISAAQNLLEQIDAQIALH